MPYCFGIKNIELAVARLATYDEVGPFYIYPLREGSDDCWDGPAFTAWSAREQCVRMWDKPPRPCSVWIGMSDRDVLACFRTKGN